MSHILLMKDNFELNTESTTVVSVDALVPRVPERQQISFCVPLHDLIQRNLYNKTGIVSLKTHKFQHSSGLSLQNHVYSPCH